MNVLLFGVLADVTGKTEVEIKAIDTDSLKKDLLTQFPLLNQYRFQLAVNKEKIKNNVSLSEADEVALLPPFAGG